MSWWGPYVGLPFVPRGRDRTGLDCWGLARMVYASELAIDLPSFDAISPIEARRVATEMESARDVPPWHAVDQPRAFDMLLMAGRPGGRVALHVGVMVDATHVLHTFKGQNSCVLPLKHHFIAPLVLGWQRHQDAPSEV